jgi:hypothetical protein
MTASAWGRFLCRAKAHALQMLRPPNSGEWTTRIPNFAYLLEVRAAPTFYVRVPDKAAPGSPRPALPKLLRSGHRKARGMQMGITAWALIVLLSVAFVAVLMMATLSLTRSDSGE